VEVQVRRFDLRSEPVPSTPTVAANLLAPLLLQWAASLPQETSRVIAGGILAREADQVSGGFGLRERARRVDGDWAALLLERTKPGP
jgi:ribosomal protein L11 methylase PrmA